MATDAVKLFHSISKGKIEVVLAEGLRASSAFSDLGLEMRRGVIYCWLRREDDKMWGKDSSHAYLEVMVECSRCRVAEMDFASLAMMYLQGQGGRGQNLEAADLLAKVYEVTSVVLSEYHEGMFSTPEVLVKGVISPERIVVVG